MKKYISFFRLRTVMGLQYRVAAVSGIVTQFFWGFMEIFALHAFYETNRAAYPMNMEATCAYVWLQQAFLAFFDVWVLDGEITEAIVNGNVAYELCRPLHIYDMWFARGMANRISRACLRCIPILLVACLLPKPYGISLPADGTHFVLFVFTLLLGLTVVVASCTLVYVFSFFTISADGIRILFASMSELLMGAVIPLPFFPEKIQRVLEMLPFAAMQNVALRVYSGNLTGNEMWRAVCFQAFWAVVLIVGGKMLCNAAEKKVMIQGG